MRKLMLIFVALVFHMNRYDCRNNWKIYNTMLFCLPKQFSPNRTAIFHWHTLAFSASSFFEDSNSYLAPKDQVIHVKK